MNYSKNWKDIGSTVLCYESTTFQFKTNVIITDFVNCLIHSISVNNILKSVIDNDVTLFNEEFYKQLIRDAQDNSVVIISHSSTKGGREKIKILFELFLKKYDFPVFALFALSDNLFKKPHTGMYRLLKQYFNTHGDAKIRNTAVIGEQAGRVYVKNSKGYLASDKSDIDRAFAYNIGATFHTIDEYLENDVKYKIAWNPIIIEPEMRLSYIKKLSEYENPDIINILQKSKIIDRYIICVYGAPRSGKTTFATELIKQWDASDFGKNKNLLILNENDENPKIRKAEKLLQTYNSLIIDGFMHAEKNRVPFRLLSKQYNARLIFIEINPGMYMSYLLNHVAVETAKTEDVKLKTIEHYLVYKSEYRRPEGALLYCPKFILRHQLLNYRY